jgi:hypothetical protein
MGRAQAGASVHNTWIPDRAKDCPLDGAGARERLLESLDAIYAEELPAAEMPDSREGKLFRLGSEAFVVGSHEFYLGYAATRRKMVTLDMGHYHPTESAADKISAILPFVPGVLPHLNRGLRWDSDHVVVVSDELLELAREVARLGVVPDQAPVPAVRAYEAGVLAARSKHGNEDGHRGSGGAFGALWKRPRLGPGGWGQLLPEGGADPPREGLGLLAGRHRR